MAYMVDMAVLVWRIECWPSKQNLGYNFSPKPPPRVSTLEMVIGGQASSKKFANILSFVFQNCMAPISGNHMYNAIQV